MMRMVRRVPGLRIAADLPRLTTRTIAALRRHGVVAAGQYVVDHSVRLATGLPPIYFSRITPQLYVGGQYSTRGLESLRRQGFTSLVNLREEFDDAEAGISLGRYLYLPTIDDDAPTLEDLREGVQFLRDEIQRGGQGLCPLHVGSWAVGDAHRGLSGGRGDDRRRCLAADSPSPSVHPAHRGADGPARTLGRNL